MIDLKTLKNDRERIAFLEDFRNEQNGWYLWKECEEIGRWMWRIDLEGSSIIVEERLRTFDWPAKHQARYVAEWYIVNDWVGPFEDQKASRTMALFAIKRRGGRRKNESGS